MGAYLKALLKLVESNHWVTPRMWEKIVANADEETLLYLRNEAIPNWKCFARDDWMEPTTKEHIYQLVNTRLLDLKESPILHKFFDCISDFIF